MGLLGALEGLGQGMSQVGADWAQEAKEQRMAELRDQYAQKQEGRANERQLAKESRAEKRRKAEIAENQRFQAEQAELAHGRSVGAAGIAHAQDLEKIKARGEANLTTQEAAGASRERVASIQAGAKPQTAGLDLDEISKGYRECRAGVREFGLNKGEELLTFPEWAEQAGYSSQEVSALQGQLTAAERQAKTPARGAEKTTSKGQTAKGQASAKSQPKAGTKSPGGPQVGETFTHPNYYGGNRLLKMTEEGPVDALTGKKASPQK